MSKQIRPEQVKKDNSDLWRYSTELFQELRKERFSKPKHEAYIDFCEASAIVGYTDPYDALELKLDVERFKNTLEKSDLEIFSLLMVGMRQCEIAELVGSSQACISINLKKIREKFRKFYSGEPKKCQKM